MKTIIHTQILSFKDMPILAKQYDRTVLLLRHSMRESLNNGMDPGLTPEGRNYALQCGSFLTGLEEVSFGSSPRKRTIETAQALQQGGSFAVSEIKIFNEIQDTALFSPAENLENGIKDGTLSQTLLQYFTSGKAQGMIGLKDFSVSLFDFLCRKNFDSRNTILLSHDIVCASLLLPHSVYPFKLDDWCGYIQGAALLFEKDLCHLHYIIPSFPRPRYALFV